MNYIKAVKFLFLFHCIFYFFFIIAIYFLTGGSEDARLSNKIITFLILTIATFGLVKNTMWSLNMAIIIVIWCMITDIYSIFNDMDRSFLGVIILIVSWCIYFFELKVLTKKDTHDFFKAQKSA